MVDIKKILNQLDELASNYDPYSMGLPMSEPALGMLEDVVRTNLANIKNVCEKNEALFNLLAEKTILPNQKEILLGMAELNKEIAGKI